MGWPMKHYRQLKNLYDGECIVVCNGPSLNDVPLEFLRSRPTFGCNRITLLQSEFIPTFYSCIGANQLDTPERRDTIYPILDKVEYAFINRLLINEFAHYDNVYSIIGWPRSTHGANSDRTKYSHDPLVWVGIGFTMTYIALQIADYVGFTTALMVGLDHKYDMTSDRKHFYRDGEVPLFEVAPGPHGPAKWQQGCDHVFAHALVAWKAKGKKIYNLTPDSACDVFRKHDLARWNK